MNTLEQKSSAGVQPCKRFYPQSLPEVGDLVMVNVTSIESEVINVYLMEYDHPAIISPNELSRKKIRNIRQHVRVGKQEVMEVTNVDGDYIDLSKKHLAEQDRTSYTEQYGEVKRLYSFFRRWSRICECDLIQTVLWPFYNSDNDLGVYNSFISDQGWCSNVPTKHTDNLLADFNKQFVKPIKYEIELDLYSHTLDAVDNISRAVAKGLEYSVEDNNLQCTYSGSSGQKGTIFILSTLSHTNCNDRLQEIGEIIKSNLNIKD